MKETIKIKIDLFFPFMLKGEEFSENIIGKFNEMIDDINKSKIKFEIDGKEYIGNVNFKKEKRNSFRYYKTLIIDFKIDELDKMFEKILIEDGEKEQDEKSELRKFWLFIEVEKYIMDFTFAINLAYPGFFEFEQARIFFNNENIKKSKIDIMLVDWFSVNIDYWKNGWPKINSLKFEQVWEWLKNKTNFFEGISKTEVDRALNALTYTMGDVSYEQVFYILMGIEALYNDNANNGIAEQIRVKTESLLKRPEKYKKKISKFYDNRSKFIHGKLNFPNKYCPYDATKEFEEFFFDNYIETVDNAKAILISTIQEYIIQNAREMKVKVLTTLEN